MLQLLDHTYQKKALLIYENAKKDLMANGIDMWDAIYPNPIVLDTDLKQQHLFGYFENHELVACIALNEIQSPEYTEVHWKYTKGTPWVVHRLCVHPKTKGRGIAQKIMKHAEQLAKEKGYTSIRLDAFQQNPAALYLYQKIGYQKVGEVTFRKGRFDCFEKSLLK